jgi:Tfp pilus assembly protein PilV
LRKTPSTLRAITGFTLVEVMMAATILTVGLMGLIQAVTMCSGLMDQARRQTLATQILTQEIEKLRFKSWAEIQLLTATTPTPPAIDSRFDDAIATTGAVFNLSRAASYVDPSTNANTATDTGLREITFTLTWTVTTSRRDGSNNPVKFTYTRINSALFGKYGLNLSFQRS